VKDLISPFHKALDDAKNSAVTIKPTADRDASYQLGFIQGRFCGLADGLRLVQAWLDSQDKHNRDI
jgi:hypothetical protein